MICIGGRLLEVQNNQSIQVEVSRMTSIPVKCRKEGTFQKAKSICRYSLWERWEVSKVLPSGGCVNLALTQTGQIVGLGGKGHLGRPSKICWRHIRSSFLSLPWPSHWWIRARDKDEVGRALLATDVGYMDRRFIGLMIEKRWKSSSCNVALVGIDGKLSCRPEWVVISKDCRWLVRMDGYCR